MLDELDNWLQLHDFGSPVRSAALSGGCINDTRRLYFANDATLVLKQNPSAPATMFQQEAIGLQALSQTTTMRVPEVHAVGEQFLLLEDLGAASPRSNYWPTLGTQLAQLHAKQMPQFGFTHDNYCGLTLQVNPECDNGWEFFAQHRIGSLTRRAEARGLLNSEEVATLMDIASRLDQLVPEMPAVLIHGDLWSGNIHSDHAGMPALIDPACYWGWAEAELAMTLLFGEFPDAFYAAYSESSSLDPGWRDRAPLYNLYHLLNHLLLFGDSYRLQIQGICKRFK